MTVVIISILLGLFLLGLVIPQKRYYPSKAEYDQWLKNYPVMSKGIESLRLNDIYMSPLTLFFLGLFFVNLVVVVGHRIPVVLRRAYLLDRNNADAADDKQTDDPRAIRIMVEGDRTEVNDDIYEKAPFFFRKRLWSVMPQGRPDAFIAVKNRFSPLGFLFFHLSFLLCLLGGLLVMYTRFSGNLTLSEGEEFHSDIKQFRRIIKTPKIFKELPELGLVLLKVNPRHEGIVGVDLDIMMRVKYFSENFEIETRVNEPIRKGAISVLPLDIGMSPLFILNKKGGEELTGGYFSLNVLKGSEDSFEFPEMPYRTYVRFYPDFEMIDGEPKTRSWNIKNPMFRLRVEREGTVLFDDYRRPGEFAYFEGYALYCRDLRYWVDFLVIREYGDTPLFIGFIVGVIGLIMRLIFYQRTLRVRIEKQADRFVLFLSGRSEYYQRTFLEESMPRLADEFVSYLNREGLSASREAAA